MSSAPCGSASALDTSQRKYAVHVASKTHARAYSTVEMRQFNTRGVPPSSPRLVRAQNELAHRVYDGEGIVEFARSL